MQYRSSWKTKAVKFVSAAVDSPASYPYPPCSSLAGYKIVLSPVVIHFNFNTVNLMQRHLLTVNLSAVKQKGTNFADLCKEYLIPLKTVENAG